MTPADDSEAQLSAVLELSASCDDKDTATLQHLQNLLGDEYFLRFTADEIAWHMRTLGQETDTQREHIFVRPVAESTEIAVYTADHDMLFANLTGLLSQLGLNILDARVMTAGNGYAFDVFNVVDQAGDSLDAATTRRVIDTLPKHTEPVVPLQSNFTTRKLRAFSLKPTVTYGTERSRKTTSVLITATDHPGLLYQIARSFRQHNIAIHAAKIATFGEKAEDVFYITDTKGRAVSDESLLDALRDTLIHNLSTELAL
ncbi:MAG: hypothetical protein AAF499_11185 [Pseudomonadota bacterium]